MSQDDALTARSDSDRIVRLERQVALLSAEVTRLFSLVEELTKAPELPEGWRRVLHGSSGESLRAQQALEDWHHGR